MDSHRLRSAEVSWIISVHSSDTGYWIQAITLVRSFCCNSLLTLLSSISESPTFLTLFLGTVCSLPGDSGALRLGKDIARRFPASHRWCCFDNSSPQSSTSPPARYNYVKISFCIDQSRWLTLRICLYLGIVLSSTSVGASSSNAIACRTR